jgi:parallel beta-helix repeat protein
MLIILLGCLLAGACEGPVAADGSCCTPLIYYMSPAGNDAADGSRIHPVQTLARIQEILEGRLQGRNAVVRIYSNAGKYYTNGIVWTHVRPGHTITFEAYPDTAYAEFEPAGSDSEAFFLLDYTGGYSQLRFRKLAVRHFTGGAISLIGDRYHLGEGWNGRNVVDDCVFDSIGNASDPSAQMCYGVLDFVNSREDTVRGCTFIDCANAPANLGPNAIYLAHHSSGNIVEGNSFLRFHGDCIRLRDASNDNRIYGNTFRDSGLWLALITSWYCYDLVNPCEIFECPPQGNLIYRNTTCNCKQLYLDQKARSPYFPPPVPCVDARDRATVYDNDIDNCD